MYGLGHLRLLRSVDHPAGLDYKGHIYWLARAGQLGDGSGERACPTDTVSRALTSIRPQQRRAPLAGAWKGMASRWTSDVGRRFCRPRSTHSATRLTVHARTCRPREQAQHPHLGAWVAAYVMLAQCYRDGRGVPKDLKRMAALYERWADKDRASASLGDRYSVESR